MVGVDEMHGRRLCLRRLWIPAFAGMTTLVAGILLLTRLPWPIYRQGLTRMENKRKGGAISTSFGGINMSNYSAEFLQGIGEGVGKSVANSINGTIYLHIALVSALVEKGVFTTADVEAMFDKLISTIKSAPDQDGEAFLPLAIIEHARDLLVGDKNSG